MALTVLTVLSPHSPIGRLSRRNHQPAHHFCAARLSFSVNTNAASNCSKPALSLIALPQRHRRGRKDK